LLKIPSLTELLKRGYTSKEAYVKDFINNLAAYAHNCGLTIKPDETWFSFHIFEFGRKYFVDGALKLVSRIPGDANMTIPTLRAKLSGLYSTGASAAGNDYVAVPSFFVSTFEAISLLSRENAQFAELPEDRVCLFMCCKNLT